MTEREPEVLAVKNIGQCIGCYSCMLACSTNIHKSFSLLKSAILVKTSGGYQGRMVVNICRGCLTAPCVEECPHNALSQRQGGGVLYRPENCTGCRKCIVGCTVNAIGFDEEEKKIIVCRQCGACARQCPHDVLGMEVREYL